MLVAACGARTGLDVEGSSRDASLATRDGATPEADGGLDGGPRDAAILPPPERAFLEIHAGRDHTCALDEDGRVRCWGDNRDGELVLLGVRDSLVPVAIELPPIVRLAAGHDQSCAIDTDARAWCWGTLGPTDTMVSAPALVDGPLRKETIDVGSATTCTLRPAGTVACSGQLGFPRSNAFRARLMGATAVRVGSTHACAIVDAGVQCFGLNSGGELGVPRFDAPPWEVEPIRVPDVRDATSIAPGFDHTCASHRDGTVTCWGSNSRGQLGLPELATGTPPTRVPGVDGVDRVEAGWSSTCAIRRGELWCWGDGTHGQLGTGRHFEPRAPERVDLRPPVRSVSLGVSHACAIDGDGRPWCWGANVRGQLGDGTRENRYVPTPVAL